jgi:hypothetical protein
MSTYVNYVSLRGGRVAAICECCGKRSKATKPDHKGEPETWEIGFGWSAAPYPKDFQHDDGSTGSTYTCPACNKRLRAGEVLVMRDGRHCKQIV